MTAVTKIQERIDELLAVLDKDIQHIRQSLSRLNELRRMVVKRDDVGLSKLLEQIQSESDSYRGHEKKRQSIRKQLAAALGCSFEQMTLSRLEARLSGEKKAQVTSTKTELKTLIEELKKEHLRTALLLSQCVRFNNLLLKSIFALGRSDAVTYSPQGTARRSTRGQNTAFVNIKF